MKIKRNILDEYYEFIEKNYCCKTSDELLGKKYIVRNQFGTGDFLRIKIEDGLEISKLTNQKMSIEFDTREWIDDILEVGYCYSGYAEILSLPDNKEYMLKEGDIFIYNTFNDVDCFKFKYKNCKSISIHMNFNSIKNSINPIWEDKLIIDWQENINNIFKGNVLIIEKSSYDIKEIAEQIDSILIDNMMGYMKLKFKTVEFLATVIEEKYNENLSQNIDTEMIIKAKQIINKNIENPPLVKELASNLNTTVYKLQKEFKNITGSTVYKYIEKVKMDKAKYLLKSTNMQIIQIANEIGYENPSKFSNIFKRYNNMTPLKYRKMQQEN